MKRLTVAELDALRRTIHEYICEVGYVPPMRELAAQFSCPTVTAWRIVRSLGWEARGHRWIRKERNKPCSRKS